MRKHIDAIVEQLLGEVGGPDPLLLECDVSSDALVESTCSEIGDHFDGHVDAMCHSIASAHVSDLKKPFVELSREGFLFAQNISAYSLIATTRGLLPYFKCGGSVTTLSYLGSEKVVPNYGVMGPAKASLESCSRYLAAELVI